MYILDGWTGIYADEKFCDEVEQRVSYTMFNVNDVDHAPWTWLGIKSEIPRNQEYLNQIDVHVCMFIHKFASPAYEKRESI